MESPTKKSKTCGKPHLLSSTPMVTSAKVNFGVSDESEASLSLSSLSRISESDKENIQPIEQGTSESVISSSFISEDLEETEFDRIDYTVFLKKTKRIKLYGPVWNLYKPLQVDPTSLYSLLITNPRNFQDCAEDFIQVCQADREYVNTTYQLCKFFFDCAGYQKFDLKKYFAFPLNFSIICKKINSTDMAQVLESTTFLFLDKRHLAKILKYCIFNFLENFVIRAHKTGVLYSPPFGYFLDLVLKICETSKYISLTYTAYIFLIKILTAICMVKANLEISNEVSSTMDTYINILYGKIISIRYLYDTRFTSLKKKFVDELMLWINFVPRIFLKHFECISVFEEKILVDPKVEVRLAALKCYEQIVENEKIFNYLTKLTLKSFSTSLWDRVSDANSKVQLKALTIFNSLVARCWKHICEENLILDVINVIYNENFELASLAGKCLVTCMVAEGQGTSTMLEYFCHIIRLHNPELKEVFVESCFDHAKILRDFTLMIDWLLNTRANMDEVFYNCLSSLFAESVHLTLIGKPSNPRQLSKKDRSVRTLDHQVLITKIYPNIMKLLQIHHTNEAVVLNLFKVLLDISPLYLADEELTFIENLLACCHWVLLSQVVKLRDAYINSAINLSEKPLQKHVQLTSNRIKQLFLECYNLMRDEEEIIKYKAYERICETSLAIAKELEATEISKNKTPLDPLKLNSDSHVIQVKIIMTVVETIIVSTQADAVARGHKYMTYTFRMWCLNILPMTCISTLLKYYNKYNTEYGDFMENFLIKINKKDDRWISQLILDTIYQMYDNLLKKHGVVDEKTHDAKEIMATAKRLHDFKKIVTPAVMVRILSGSLKYVSEHKQYDFLIYVMFFITDQAANLSREILTIMDDVIPKEAVNNPYIISFKNRLMLSVAEINISNKVAKDSKRSSSKRPAERSTKRRKTNSSTTIDNENYSIQDSSNEE
ncbi:hypothetical protein ABEB36_000444 [Hypothenemus hampei]|uniref:Condensin complex subunit 1 C-terminal domain-containing protein n=1 Tax=Hypothenemus hampei TaxID=57062 RepID=A0ABD1FB87_HYPHA